MALINTSVTENFSVFLIDQAIYVGWMDTAT